MKMLLIIFLASYRFSQRYRHQDIAGVVSTGHSGVFFTATGLTVELAAESARSVSIHDLRWYNHLIGPF